MATLAISLPAVVLPLVSVGLVSALMAMSVAPLHAGALVHPFHATQPAQAPDEVHLAVEIPAGSAIKYEIGADGLVYVDRFLSMPVVYPGNYGALPRTRGGDGDPLDAVVFTREPLHPGVLIRFRPIGYLRMVDGGEADEKIIGVPVDAVDPGYADIRGIDDLPAMERARIEAFFRVYKDLPAGQKTVELDGFGDAAQARELIGEAMRRYGERNVEVRAGCGTPAPGTSDATSTTIPPRLAATAAVLDVAS